MKCECDDFQEGTVLGIDRMNELYLIEDIASDLHSIQNF